MAWSAIIPIALGFLGFGGSREGESDSSGRNIKWLLIFIGVLVVLFLAFSIYLNYIDMTFTDYFYKLFTGVTKDEWDSQQSGNVSVLPWYVTILSPQIAIASLLGGTLGIFAKK